MGIQSKYIIGIDEVGRGALSGPVFMAGVCLDNNYPILTSYFDESGIYKEFKDFIQVRDSKNLKAVTRENISRLVSDQQINNVILSASNTLIDNFGIGVCLSHIVGLIISILYQQNTNTTVIIDGKIKLLAQYNQDLIKALVEENLLDKSLSPTPSLIPTDSNKNIFDQDNKFQIIRENKADDKYLSIALASNIAKVKRDKLMTELSMQYPIYDWATNKGYGTAKHRLAIAKNPENEYMRKSFLGKILNS